MESPAVDNPYERQRQALPKQKRKSRKHLTQEPSRHSSRLQADAADDFDETAGASDLALCMINGQCPRCGKVIEGQHKRHLDTCNGSKKRRQGKGKGHVEIEGLEELEAEEADAEGAEGTEARPAKRSKPTKSQAEKLAELELSGLVAFTSEAARFVVIGSTGNHYEVELKNPAPSCQCVDFRMRRRICKHQNLVLNQLGIPDKPEDWREAVSAKLDEEAHAHKPDPDADIKPDTEASIKPEPDAEMKPEPDADTKTEIDAEMKAEPGTCIKPDPAAEMKTQSDVKPGPGARDQADTRSGLVWPKRARRKR